MKKRSAKALECIHRAKAMADDLFPWNCMDIVQEVYGDALDKVRGCDICELLDTMMGNAVDDTSHYQEDIEQLVANYMEA